MTKNNYQVTSKAYFTQLKIVHFALVMGVVIFGAVTIFINTSNGTNTTEIDTSNIFIHIVLLVSIGGVFASLYISRFRLKAARTQTNLFEKLQGYLAAQLLKYIFLEIPAMFALIWYMLDGSVVFIVAGATMIAMLASQRPSKFSLAKDLGLSPEEQKLLDDPAHIL